MSWFSAWNATRGKGRQAARRLLGAGLRGLGNLVANLAGFLGGGSRVPTDRDIGEALQVMTEVSVPPPPAPPRVPTPSRGSPRPRLPSPPGPRNPRQGLGDPDDWPEEHGVDTRRVVAHEKPSVRGGQRMEGLSEEVEARESSNVFSFMYDSISGILYVTFKAGAGPGAKNGGKRPHIRGPMYAYGGGRRPVPPRIFEQMKSATSKGKFVWDELRVRGTIHGHKYPYRLVKADLGRGRPYVPRKATRRGLRTRTLPSVGRGRRASVRSVLPERIA